MLKNATTEKMLALRLPALAEALQSQLGRPEFAELSPATSECIRSKARFARTSEREGVCRSPAIHRAPLLRIDGEIWQELPA